MIPMRFAELLNEPHIDVLVGELEDKVQPLMPYSDDTCNFLDTVSRRLLSDRRVKTFSDVASFAYWCRKANILAKRTDFNRREGDRVRLGRGLAFHIAPSNIPVNFAFSFVFSLLSGNANIVRVPSKKFSQVNIICDAISESIRQFPNLMRQNVFVRYPSSEDKITEKLSEHADVRIIWGGDATVERLKSMKSSPRCVDIAFADRYSIAIMDGNKILSLDEAGLKRLARAFYNDTYLIDQNACSSPMTIFWLNDSQVARVLFWSSVGQYAHAHYDLQLAISFEKYVKLSEDVATSLVLDVDGSNYDGYVTHVDITPLLQKDNNFCISNLRGRGGYFYEAAINSIGEFLPHVTNKVQTLVYFGIEPKTIARLIAAEGISGIDRIVPVGNALDIDVIWDGFDLVSVMSRVISS